MILGIAILFVSPAFTVEPTAMRASRQAEVFFWLLVAVASIFLGFFAVGPAFVMQRVAFWPERVVEADAPPDVIAQTCARLC